GPPRLGGCDGQRARRAVLDQPAGVLQAPEGAGTGGAGGSGTRHAVPPLPARDGPAGGGLGPDLPLHRGTGRTPGPPRRGGPGDRPRIGGAPARSGREAGRGTGRTGRGRGDGTMSKHTVGKTEFTIEPGRHDVTITRVFDAPREAVLKALTDPDLVPPWWGPARYPTRVEKADLRPGGDWRVISADGDTE